MSDNETRDLIVKAIEHLSTIESDSSWVRINTHAQEKQFKKIIELLESIDSKLG